MTGDDQEQAGSIAVESVKRDLPSNISETGQSRIAAVEIEIMEDDNAESELEPGYSFYLMKGQSS